MVLTRDDVYRIVRQHGPIFPARIKRHLGQGDITTIGAYLSELRGAGHINITSVKIGSSPFYYTPEQARKLEPLAEHLNEKDRRAFEQLRRARVLRDASQEPLVRVCLRSIRDYAIPLTVRTDQGEQTFWKYYLVSDAEAERLIREQLGERTDPAQAADAQAPAEQPDPSPRPAQSTTQPVNERSGQQTIGGEAPPAPKPVAKAPRRRAAKSATEQTVGPEVDDFDYTDKLYKKAKRFFEEKKIRIKHKRIVRKHSDIEMTITIPTAIGRQEFFCKVKEKKKSNDGDLAAALLTGKLNNLPVLYLTTGEVTKKALEKLDGELKGLSVKQL